MSRNHTKGNGQRAQYQGQGVQYQGPVAQPRVSYQVFTIPGYHPPYRSGNVPLLPPTEGAYGYAPNLQPYVPHQAAASYLPQPTQGPYGQPAVTHHEHSEPGAPDTYRSVESENAQTHHRSNQSQQGRSPESSGTPVEEGQWKEIVVGLRGKVNALQQQGDSQDTVIARQQEKILGLTNTVHALQQQVHNQDSIMADQQKMLEAQQQRLDTQAVWLGQLTKRLESQAHALRDAKKRENRREGDTNQRLDGLYILVQGLQQQQHAQQPVTVTGSTVIIGNSSPYMGPYGARALPPSQERDVSPEQQEFDYLTSLPPPAKGGESSINVWKAFHDADSKLTMFRPTLQRSPVSDTGTGPISAIGAAHELGAGGDAARDAFEGTPPKHHSRQESPSSDRSGNQARGGTAAFDASQSDRQKAVAHQLPSSSVSAAVSAPQAAPKEESKRHEKSAVRKPGVSYQQALKTRTAQAVTKPSETEPSAKPDSRVPRKPQDFPRKAAGSEVNKWFQSRQQQGSAGRN